MVRTCLALSCASSPKEEIRNVLMFAVQFVIWRKYLISSRCTVSTAPWPWQRKAPPQSLLLSIPLADLSSQSSTTQWRSCSSSEINIWCAILERETTTSWTGCSRISKNSSISSRQSIVVRRRDVVWLSAPRITPHAIVTRSRKFCNSLSIGHGIKMSLASLNSKFVFASSPSTDLFDHANFCWQLPQCLGEAMTH